LALLKTGYIVLLDELNRRLFQISSLILCLSACDADECLDFEFTPPPLTVTIRDAETDELLCDVSVRQNCRSSKIKNASSPIPCLLAYPDRCEYRLYDWHATDAGVGEIAEIVIGGGPYKETTISFEAKENACGVLEAEPNTIEITLERDPDYED